MPYDNAKLLQVLSGVYVHYSQHYIVYPVPTRPEITSVDPQRRLVSWSISQPIACLEGSTVTYTPLYSIDRTISVNYSHSDPFRTEDLPSDLEETVAYNVTISAYGPAGYGERSQSFHLARMFVRPPNRYMLLLTFPITSNH